MWIRILSKQLAALALIALAGGLLAATLVRFAPGFDSDERELDPRLSPASIAAIHEERSRERRLIPYYARYLADLAHGDLGTSHSLRRPVAELLAERAPVTLSLTAWGLLGGWTIGLALAIAESASKHWSINWPVKMFSSAASGAALALPAAVIGLLTLLVRAPGWWAIALIVFPKVFTYARNLLNNVANAPHILLAKGKGATEPAILARHVFPVIAPELLALAGVSVSVAFSASIPIEAICDLPGVGQLAWQAALGRDLPVIVALTLLLTLITRAANAAADLTTAAVRR